MASGFYVRNAWWLGAGGLLTFASSFGQTYFIGLFAGEFRATFGLSNGEWGTLYTVATVASAAVLMFAGKLADTVPLARLTGGILVAYALAALLVSVAPHVAILCLGLAALRFCGQGMMGLIAMTAMARWFAANRGRAVAIVILGMPVGEALFPFLAVASIAAFGAAATWQMAALFIAAIVLPLALILLSRQRVPLGEGAGADTVGLHGRHWTRRDVLSHWSIWALLPGILASPFIGTCIFFHQVHVAEVRGFDLATMTLAFPLYAIVTVSTTLVTGAVIDRIGVVRLLPIMLLPLAAAVTVLALPGGIIIWFLTLAGTGLSQGIVVTMMGALWPTLYGTRAIGSVKAIFSASMVFSTALGPGITGLIIDAGITFPAQAGWLAVWCIVMSALFAVIAPKLAAQLPRRQPA
ncbi:MAG: MFS transporter [Pseudomonadota bacterium]